MEIKNNQPKSHKAKRLMLPIGLILLFLSIITRYFSFPDFLRSFFVGMAVAFILIYFIKNKSVKGKAKS